MSANSTDALTRKKLLIVTNVAWYFVLHRLPLAEAARDFGYDVEIASAPDTPAAVDEIRRAGFKFHELPIERSGLSPLVELRSLLAMHALYKRVAPDIVHQITVKPALYGTLAARALNVPRIVSTLPGLGGSLHLSGSLWRSLLRRAIRLAYHAVMSSDRVRIVVENSADLEFVSAEGIGREGCIYLVRGAGVDTRFFTPASVRNRAGPVVLPARMLLSKGIREFVEAARIVRAQFGLPNRFVLAGPLDRASVDAIPERQLREWSSGAVEWIGSQSDMPSLFRDSSIACLPSYREGLPTVIVEAAACGLPVVASDVPGCRDALIDGETGLLVAARDPERLAAAISSLLQNPDQADRMGIAGRAFVETRFERSKVLESNLAVFRDVSA
jgi:glycosyltransferase involved in cell wall biosynthesis